MGYRECIFFLMQVEVFLRGKSRVEDPDSSRWQYLQTVKNLDVASRLEKLSMCGSDLNLYSAWNTTDGDSCGYKKEGKCMS